jgi:hypothetical protein
MTVLTRQASLQKTLPPPGEVRRRLAEALREAELLRRLLPLAERAQLFRDCDERQQRETTRPA